MTAAVATSVAMLQLAPVSARTSALFDALASAAGPGVSVSRVESYQGGADWLMLWGYGGANRADLMARQRAAGGRVVVWDLAYWDRDRKLRVSVDAPHPEAFVMRRTEPVSRWVSDGMPTRSVWFADGPVVVAGIGDKARAHYGPGVVDRWEAARVAECRTLWPTRSVIYRPKRSSGAVPGWASGVSYGPVDRALAGAAIVVTWHSNVAIDAIRSGIPVVCQTGAAAAVCPSTVPAELAPLPAAVRDRFLANLAWWQWAPSEASACWAWLSEVLA